MSIASIIGDNILIIGVVLITGFVVWKFVIQPRENEGKPIKPSEEQIETFEEKMQKNMSTSVDF